MGQIKLRLEANNIGPHEKMSFERADLGSINIALYANNGSGKSFISRAFRNISIFENESTLDTELLTGQIRRANSLIRFGQDKGSINLKIFKNNTLQNESYLNLENGNQPIQKSDQYIFHVFNSDYVKENLESVKYKPDDNIDGYVLGKANIDLSLEKQKLEEIAEECEKLNFEITNNIKFELDYLRKIGIKQSTAEFKYINLSNLEKQEYSKENRIFKEVLAKYNKLGELPENISDVSSIIDLDWEKFIQLFISIYEMLSFEYDLSFLESGFKEKVKSKQGFIEAGLKLINNDICPFCEQKIGKVALELINLYRQFIEDEESKVIKKLESKLKEVLEFKKLILQKKNQFDSVKLSYLDLKTFFPSFEEKNLTEFPNLDYLLKEITKVESLLSKKKENISIPISTEMYCVEFIRDYSRKFSVFKVHNNKLVEDINKSKNNVSVERLTLRKSLCNSKFNELIDKNLDKIRKIIDLRAEYDNHKIIIKRKESEVKNSKRELVIQALKGHLNSFFNGKYEFDEKNFCIKFNDRILISNTDDVLSDGEKSILAFCFYLATVHTVVLTESDYEKFFFVIDDPVSSMDFHYVYAVSEKIRRLHELVNQKFTRYILLTHNMEFFSILVRNKVVKNKFILSNGVIKDFKNEFVMPYQANLIELYNVGMRNSVPTHTTANSLRHVLETIYRFEGSEESFAEFVLGIVEFKGNGFINSMINDLSHGGIREQLAITEEMLIEACQSFTKYLTNKYPGQVISLEKILNS